MSEIERFAPQIKVYIAHPSERRNGDLEKEPDLTGKDLVITTYGMLARIPWLRTRHWRMVVLDEASSRLDPASIKVPPV